MEVRDLQRAEINDDTFAVPAGLPDHESAEVRKPFTKDQREKFMRNCQESGSKEACERRLKFMDPGAAAADTGKAARNGVKGSTAPERRSWSPELRIGHDVW